MVRQPPALAGVSRSRARVCLSLRVTLAPVQGAAATTLAQQPDGSPAHPAAEAALQSKIAWASRLLDESDDVERCTALARCIFECARAESALRGHAPS